MEAISRAVELRGSTRASQGRYNPLVAPRSVRLSSPERVLFPDEGITNQDLFEYYRAIAPVLVPHLRNRPFTMKRYPYGSTGDVYFQKQAPKGMPSWIPTRTFRTYPREGGSRLVDFALLNSPEAVLWMVQMNCVDMNAWYSRVDKPDRPDFVLFDLDPPDGGFALAIRVAHLIREELERVDSSRTSRRAAPTGFTCSSRLRAARPTSRPTPSRSAWRGCSRSDTQGWSRPNG